MSRIRLQVTMGLLVSLRETEKSQYHNGNGDTNLPILVCADGRTSRRPNYLAGRSSRSLVA